jgi:hypothetical protein
VNIVGRETRGPREKQISVPGFRAASRLKQKFRRTKLKPFLRAAV